jgi:hypothetical protein
MKTFVKLTGWSSLVFAGGIDRFLANHLYEGC